MPQARAPTQARGQQWSGPTLTPTPTPQISALARCLAQARVTAPGQLLATACSYCQPSAASLPAGPSGCAAELLPLAAAERLVSLVHLGLLQEGLVMRQLLEQQDGGSGSGGVQDTLLEVLCSGCSNSSSEG